MAYTGLLRYSVTTCTSFRKAHFLVPGAADRAHIEILQLGREVAFSIFAYCFMPDHLHLLVIAEQEWSDFKFFMKTAKQITGFSFRRDHAQSLWQPGYHDRILRDDESTFTVARYILENPVRAGLASRLGEWPYAGSDVYSWEELQTLWEEDAR